MPPALVSFISPAENGTNQSHPQKKTMQIKQPHISGLYDFR